MRHWAMARPVNPRSYLVQPLDVVLGNVGNVRILRVLARHGGALPASRIARETRLSRFGAAQALSGLEALGLVERSGSGRAVLHKAVPHHPLVGLLAPLFEDEAGYRNRVLAAATAAASDLPIAGLWLFGSAARLEDAPGSDIDLALVSELDDGSAHERLADAYRERLAEQPDLAGTRPSVVAMREADLRRLIDEGSPLWADIARDARVLRGRSPQDFQRDPARPRGEGA
jgi:predicted nucleotidyltransferase